MNKRTLTVGLLAALALVLLSPLASSFPDGLERVAEDLEFIDRAQSPAYEALPDYTVPGLSSPALSTVVAGIVGVAVVFGVTWGVGALLKRRQGQGDPVATPPGAQRG